MLDLTTLWAWLQKNKHHAGKLILALLIFVVGWQTGKIMSPYYAAHPIVFEDKPCDTQASSGGTPAELTTLQEEGRKETADPKRAGETLGDDAAEPAAVGKTPAGAGETPGVNEKTPGVKEAPVIAGTSAPSSQKQFVGSVNSSLYHHKDCSTASRIKPENQLWFASTAEAEAAGYQPSKCTRDKLGL